MKKYKPVYCLLFNSIKTCVCQIDTFRLFFILFYNILQGKSKKKMDKFLLKKEYKKRTYYHKYIKPFILFC